MDQTVIEFRNAAACENRGRRGLQRRYSSALRRRAVEYWWQHQGGGGGVAGIVEEAAFRGYMQGPIERHHGLAVAILITGTMFAIAHLDFTLILWPYYVAVAAIYGSVTYLTESILPAVVLHTSGNIYSNIDLWLHGQAEWQASSDPALLIWKTGADASFWISSISLLIVAAAMVWAYFNLAGAAQESRA